MDKTTLSMDKNTRDFEVYREDRFRTPSNEERALGLWVDRIGEGISNRRLTRLRILGQMCHIVILKGEGEYRSQRYGTHPVRTGDCMIQFPDEPCLYHPNDTWTTRFITWNGPETERLHKQGVMLHSQPVFHDTDMAISRTYHQLLPIMTLGTPISALRRKTLMLQMVLTLYESQQKLSGSSSSHNNPIEHALTIMHQRFNQNDAIPEIARSVGLSTTHFRRRFQTYTGLTPLAYIRNLRIAEAERLLREGTPIKQVAAAVGYEDPFYFMRVFRKSVGIPPGAYTHRHNP